MTSFLIALPCIAAFSAALVWIDPLTIVADWWSDRKGT